MKDADGQLAWKVQGMMALGKGWHGLCNARDLYIRGHGGDSYGRLIPWDDVPRGIDMAVGTCHAPAHASHVAGHRGMSPRSLTSLEAHHAD